MALTIFTWVLACISLVGVVLNIYKMRTCFIIWAFTNFSWMLYDFYIEEYAQSALFLTYFILAIWGMMKWSEEK